jgi:hypothetical protein
LLVTLATALLLDKVVARPALHITIVRCAWDALAEFLIKVFSTFAPQVTSVLTNAPRWVHLPPLGTNLRHIAVAFTTVVGVTHLLAATPGKWFAPGLRAVSNIKLKGAIFTLFFTIVHVVNPQVLVKA